MIPRTFLPVISELAQRIDDLLPQTQCTKCGFDGCTPYARAIAEGRADFNQCPPGGQEGVVRLAQLLGRPAKPLDISHGVERPRPRAVIDESVCIGCTLCAKACPVDAIVGAAKLMHTVLNDACTGCDLCVAPCPVDCIEMVPITGDATGWDAWTATQAAAAREQHARRNARLAAEQQAADERAALRVRQARMPWPPIPAAGGVDTGAAAAPNGAEITSGAGTGSATSDAQTTASSASQASRPPVAGDDGGVSIEALERARKQAIIQAALDRARARRAAGQPDASSARKPPGT
ncbi:electron transport complex subunit RsxB [Robbsia sp. KACC 23696]|uniref:electron transport complex subunit RsxB n=1 Tax=Robbsia sp. KACC 23696 TaxID=3149231 RepID=UPI00325B33C7